MRHSEAAKSRRLDSNLALCLVAPTKKSTVIYLTYYSFKPHLPDEPTCVYSQVFPSKTCGIWDRFT